MVILVMYDHFHGINRHFALWSINFQQLIKNVLNIVLSKPVPLYTRRKAEVFKFPSLVFTIVYGQQFPKSC